MSKLILTLIVGLLALPTLALAQGRLGGASRDPANIYRTLRQHQNVQHYSGWQHTMRGQPVQRSRQVVAPRVAPSDVPATGAIRRR